MSLDAIELFMTRDFIDFLFLLDFGLLLVSIINICFLVPFSHNSIMIMVQLKMRYENSIPIIIIVNGILKV